MGVIEQSARRGRRWGAFQKALLFAAVGGVMVAIGAVPDFSKILKYYTGQKKGARLNYRVKSVLGRLVTKGLITFEERNGKQYACLTDAGKRVLELETLKDASTRKPKRWDKRWRVVIFDIPERRRSIRVRLRRFMEEYGFVRLQDSVWVYPYDCEELISLVKAKFRIGTDVLYMIVEQLERDKHLREHFDLPTEQ
ncbi:MAG: CRISPR-associated endonuclease Cas2 [Candidatus Pacebacteria bacterium]|nr:CRISPR-associated endonuclease Cas2 [Candidatus Paceibacterota bacterium]